MRLNPYGTQMAMHLQTNQPAMAFAMLAGTTRRGSIMTIAQLITLLLVFGSFALGRYSGYHDGYVKGRIAVRRYYESIERVSR
jgi:hypothetical protein